MLLAEKRLTMPLDSARVGFFSRLRHPGEEFGRQIGVQHVGNGRGSACCSLAAKRIAAVLYDLAIIAGLVARLVRRPCTMLADGDTPLDALRRAVVIKIALNAARQHEQPEARDHMSQTMKGLRPASVESTTRLVIFARRIFISPLGVTTVSPPESKFGVDLSNGE